MKLNTMFRCGKQASPISEGVAEIRINSQPYKWNNMTTRLTQNRRAPRVVIVHDVVKELSQVLPHPSAVFHTYVSVNTQWVARTLSHCTPMKQGNVSPTLATHDTTQFVRPHECRMRQYTTQSLLIQTQPTRPLIDSGGGYHLGAPNFKSDHSPSFPSNILRFPLIAPPSLLLCKPFDHLAKSA
jgi:hypothetical protein